MDGSPSRGDEYCTNCGERITRSANYCYYCGEQLGGGSTRPAPREPQSDGRGRPGRATDQPVAGGETREGTATDTAVPAWSTRASESPLRTVLVALGLVGGGFASGLLLSGLVVGILSLVSLPDGVSFFVVLTFQFAGFVVFALGYLTWRGLGTDTIRSYFGVRRPSLREVGLIFATWVGMIVVAGVVAQIVMLAVTELMGSGTPQEPAENPVGDVVANNPEILPAMILFMFLVVGPSEEILFRGTIQSRLRERLSAIPAILIASAVFASAHVLALWGQDPVAIAMTITILFVPSIGFGAIYEYTGNLVVPSLLHGFHNSVVVTVVLLGAQQDVQAGLLWLAPA